VTSEVHSSIWVVHADGSGLHEVDVQPSVSVWRRELRSDGRRLLRPELVAGRHEDRLRQGPERRRRREHLQTVNVDGTGLAQVTHAGGSQSPDWGVHSIAQ